MKMMVAVAAGGAIGAVARMCIQSLLNHPQGWPWGTLLSNVLGCFCAGVLIHRGQSMSPVTQGFMMTGTLGALTTFSSFAVEGVKLFMTKDYLRGSAYTSLTLISSLLACLAGWYLSTKITIGQ